jgi:hypothetical protein
MQNYTNPENNGEDQSPNDLLNASLIFARALGLILQEKEGIVIDVIGDMDLGPDVNKCIVFLYKGLIHVHKCEEDLPEGTVVNMEEEISE